MTGYGIKGPIDEARLYPFKKGLGDFQILINDDFRRDFFQVTEFKRTRPQN
jgi:hypothetical protein